MRKTVSSFPVLLCISSCMCTTLAFLPAGQYARASRSGISITDSSNVNTSLLLSEQSTAEQKSSQSTTSTGTSTSTSPEFSSWSSPPSSISYTKGSAIFPACNQREITLADSFPNGVIPSQAKAILEKEAPHLIPQLSQQLQGEEEDTSKRNFLLGTLGAASAVAASSKMDLPFLVPSKTIVMDIPQAIQWIDENCDRRFLHAVIASDYQFLYRGITNLHQNEIRYETMGSETSDLLLDGTYTDSTDALPFFQTLQTTLEKETVNPANGHLTTSSSEEAGKWGVAASVWPVNGAHYAWFQDQGLFYPRSSSTINRDIQREDIIVDGKDCGKDSLEDALRAESCEVLLATDGVLVVPAVMDQQLRDALKSSFLV